MKQALFAAGLAVLVLAGCTAVDHATMHKSGKLGPRYAPMVNWYTLAEGRAIALREKKPMLVDFAVPENCSRCTFLQNNVYNRDEIVAKINGDFIPIWCDLSGDLTPEEMKLGEAFDYKDDCLLLFLDHRGEIIKDPEGVNMCFPDKVEPQVFIDYLDYVLKEFVPAG